MRTLSFSMSSRGSSSRCVEPTRRDYGSYCTVFAPHRNHPLFLAPAGGQALSRKGQQPLPNGARAFVCVLPDGTSALVPEWMTSREACARCQLASTPQVSVAALQDLDRFLGTRREQDLTIGTDATPGHEEEARSN